MSTLTPHGACLLWKPEWIWLNAVSDAILAGAFFAIAFVVGLFVWRRRDIMYRRVFGIFAIFAVVCGIARLLSILTLWVPAYDIEGLTKGFLALISLGITAALLLCCRGSWCSRHARNFSRPMRRLRRKSAPAQGRGHGQAFSGDRGQRGPGPASAEDGSHRPTHRWSGARLQQHSDRDHRNHRNPRRGGQGSSAARPDHRYDQRRRGEGADLTRHLLAFGRRQPLQPRNTDVNALVIDAARVLRPTLGEQIEIESMLAHDSAPALIDPSQLSTAILNLALNARDAMPDGGKLTLETRNVVLDENYPGMTIELKPGNYVMIAVSDTGEGIPGSLLDKVFEPFFTTKEVGKGSGLGLSMVYGFVKQSNGHIKIYSEEGHGTTVKLYLPAAVGVPDELAAEAGISWDEHGDESILIVEDDALVREYVVTQISRFGSTHWPPAMPPRRWQSLMVRNASICCSRT